MNVTILVVYGVVVLVLTAIYIYLLNNVILSKDKVEEVVKRLIREAERNIILDSGAAVRSEGFYRRKALRERDKLLKKCYTIWLLIILVATAIVLPIAFIVGSNKMNEEIAASYVPYVDGEDDVSSSKYNWGTVFGYDRYTGELQDGGQKVLGYSSEVEAFISVLKRECELYESTPGLKGGTKYYKYWNEKRNGRLDLNGKSGGWCACFIHYCAGEAGLLDSTLECCKDAQCNLQITKSVEMGYAVHYAKNTGGYGKEQIVWYEGTKAEEGKQCTYTPQPGDLVIFNWYADGGTYTPGRHMHIGAVAFVENGVIYTIEGNTSGSGKGTAYNRSSSVKLKNRGSGCAKGYAAECWYVTPDWKLDSPTTVNTTNNSNSNVKSASTPDEAYKNATFSMNNYNKNGVYYDANTTKQIIYDYLRIELGYNRAAAAGALGNIAIESRFNYDMVEAIELGKIYRKSDNKFVSTGPGISSDGEVNGNYKDDLPGIMSVLFDPDLFGYYYIASKDGVTHKNYAHGYGIVQWSGGRTVNCLKHCGVDPNIEYKEPFGDNLNLQLEYLKIELENNYKSCNEKLLNISDNTNGARDACEQFYRGVEGAKLAESARINQALSAFNEFEDRWPPDGSVTYGQSGSASEINITLVGGTDALNLYNLRTSVSGAKNIIAINNAYISVYDSMKSREVGTTTIPDKTILNSLGLLETSSLNTVVIVANALDITSMSNFSNKLTKTLDTIKNKNSTAKVYICNVPLVNEEATNVKNEDILKLNKAINDTINSYKGPIRVSLVDVSSYLDSTDMGTTSGTGHQLTPAGYARLANFIKQSCT